MKRRDLLRSTLAAAAAMALPAGAAAPPATPTDDRAFWLAHLQRVARPVLSALAQRRLVATMPVESAPGHLADRRKVTHLEALGRTLSGIAPWLEQGPTTGPESAIREQFCTLARESIASGVDPKSPDYLRFGEDRQTIVDAAFLALALVRAPRELREKLPTATRAQLADALRATRALLPPYNNWLLFAAMIEACLFQLGEPWDRMRVDYALRQHQLWFLGDGTYGDGPHLHWDYYNSFVIQPFLLSLMDAVATQEAAWSAMRTPILTRAQRYAAIQERLIAPDGTYPIFGRSIAYRCGAFQLLAEVAHRQSLPEPVTPAQVRSALTAVIHRTLDPAGTFDPQGWLQIGLAGHQPGLGETYISTGSLYLCTAVFLPLGLPPENPFWSAPADPWTSQQLWQGANLPADHAQDT
jgi:hypothetical protein